MDKAMQKRLDALQSVLVDKRMEAERRKPYYMVWIDTLTVDKWTVSLHHRASPEQDTTEEMTSAELQRWLKTVRGKRVYLDMFKCIEWFYIWMMVTVPKMRGRPQGEYTRLLENIERDNPRYPHLREIRADSRLIAAMTKLEQVERIA